MCNLIAKPMIECVLAFYGYYLYYFFTSIGFFKEINFFYAQNHLITRDSILFFPFIFFILPFPLPLSFC